MFDYQRVTTVSKKLEALSQGACQTRSRLYDLVGNTPLRARPWFEKIHGHPFSAFTQKPNLLKQKGRSWMILPICLSGFTNSWHVLPFQPVQRSMNIHGICCRNAGIPGIPGACSYLATKVLPILPNQSPSVFEAVWSSSLSSRSSH